MNQYRKCEYGNGLGNALLGLGLDGLVEKSGNVFLAEPLRRADHHHAILDAQSIEVIDHHVIWLRKQSWLTRKWSILVQDHLGNWIYKC